MTQLAARRLRAGLAAIACVALGACNGVGDTTGASLEQSVPGAPSGMQALATRQSSAAAPSSAVASLPVEAGTIAAVRVHAYVNGFRQDIALKGGAVRGIENGITVLARTSQQATLDEATPLFKPTEAAIRSELGRTFPHIAMQVVERASANAYGSYGLALGRAGGTIHCIYAWQWIEQGDLGRDAGLTGPVAIRIRLCKPDTTFDALADLVNHLSIRRDAGAAVADAGAIVEPPQEATAKPRKRRVARHAHRAPDAGRRVVADMPTVVPTAPVAPQPLASDLPPQAFQGPKGQPSSTKPN